MLKPREERRKVLIRARMHAGVSWSDVCILNMSLHGLGLQCAFPPRVGTYVEIRRGAHVVVGRVIWSSHHRFGVSTQDVLFIDAIINAPDAAGTTQCLPRPPERRAKPRTSHDRSRLRARAFECAFAAFGGLCIAAALGGMVQAALARPLVAISTALVR